MRYKGNSVLLDCRLDQSNNSVPPQTPLLQARVPFSDLLVWQKVNHFPEAKQLTRKDLLKKHLVRYQASKLPVRGRLGGG